MKKLIYHLSFIIPLMLFSFIFTGAKTRQAEKVRHTFLCADYTQGIVCIISDEGKLLWMSCPEKS
jgi:Leu/Phe-tRNA-protein transferase